MTSFVLDGRSQISVIPSVVVDNVGACRSVGAAGAANTLPLTARQTKLAKARLFFTLLNCIMEIYLLWYLLIQ